MMRPWWASLLAVTIAAAAFTSALGDDLEKLLNIADDNFRPIDRPLDHPPFIHRKVITVTNDSLTSGWVTNYQCHRHFSKTSSLDIIFPPADIRRVQIQETNDIGMVRVHSNTIQLENVTQTSSLCFDSENRVLRRDSGNIYRLTAGPFYYRFLDGYFPIQVDVKVDYPSPLLKVLRITPDARPGIEVTDNEGEVRITSLFEGKLWIEIVFEHN